MNLIYQLHVLSIMPFTLEKPVAPFQTIWMDTGSPPQYWTQTCQLPSTHNPTRSLSKNAGLLVSYTKTTRLHPRPHPLPIWNWIPTRPPILTHHWSQNPLTPRIPHSSQWQSLLFYCWGRPWWFGQKSTIFVLFNHYMSSDARPWARRCYHLSSVRAALSPLPV